MTKESINDYMEKIKQFIDSEKGKDIMIIIIVILVGLGSFELGRLSNENGSNGVKIEYPSQSDTEQANVISATNSTKKVSAINNSTGKSFFASSKGSKYYTTSCSAGKTIKQENRIYFETGEEAQTDGYALSSSCK